MCGCGLVGGSFLGSGEGCGRPIRGIHTLGDWPVVPTGEVNKGEGVGGDKGRAPPQGDRPVAPTGEWDKGEEGGGDGRSRTVAQEDGDACIDGCCPRQRMFHIEAGFATAPCF